MYIFFHTSLQLLDVFFGFLGRKTDFFTGVGRTEAEKIVLSKFREHQKKIEEVCCSLLLKFFLNQIC